MNGNVVFQLKVIHNSKTKTHILLFTFRVGLKKTKKKMTEHIFISIFINLFN